MAGERGHTLRLAVAADAEALALVHIKSWREIYKGVFPGHVLERLKADRHAAYWRSLVAAAPGGTVVCERGRAVIGFLSLGAAGAGDSRESAGEITSIYLDPQHWRRGYGAALMRWALSEAERQGWRRLILWSLQENHHAQAFYESVGFRPDGACKTGHLGERFSGVEEMYVTLVRFARRLPG
jgi:ribosomal protein S18 acetylase RimI-like enzyme